MTRATFVAELCERLDLPDGATEPEILAAVNSRLEASAYGLPPGVVMIDETVLADLQARAAGGTSARAAALTRGQLEAVDNAVRTGRINGIRARYWRDRLAADPAAEQQLNSLPPRLRIVPAAVDQGDDIYAKAWGSPAAAPPTTADDDPNYPEAWH